MPQKKTRQTAESADATTQAFAESRRQSAIISHEKRMQVLIEGVMGPMTTQAARLIDKGDIEGAEKVLTILENFSKKLTT